MKKLSYWSKNNPGKARIIIAICHLLLITLGIAFGIFTYFDDFRIPYGSLFVMANVFCIAYILYPKRDHKAGIFKYSYHRRVKHDFVLVLASTWVLAAGINDFSFQPIRNQTFEPQVMLMITKVGAENVMPSKRENRRTIIHQIKEYKVELKQQLKSMKSDQEDNDGNKTALKIALIFLTALFAFGLFITIASLSCSLSCSGNEGLAVVVLLGGTAAIIWGTIYVIGKILRAGKQANMS